MKSPPELILASTSIYRRELLQRLGLAFNCAAPGVSEILLPGEQPAAFVTRLAREKALAVAAGNPDAWVIGSDQAAVRVDASEREIILGKPGSVPACIEQLRHCSGRTVTFLTAVAVLKKDAAPVEFMDTTQVVFRELDEATIERYVESEMPLDCAGGFKSEGLGIALCESIAGVDPSALIGLPLINLAATLRAAGFEVP